MLVKAREGGQMEEAGQSDNVKLRLGSIISVCVILPIDTFQVIRYDGVHASQDRQPHHTGTIIWRPVGWDDNSTPLPFTVHCKPDAECGAKLCKAWIQQDGVAKALLEFVLYVARDDNAVLDGGHEKKASYQKLTALVLSAGVRMFNIFINYRVWTSAGLAEKMCYQLLACKFHVFWDKRNLPDGAPWEACFRIGLRHSQHVVALLSADTLLGLEEAVVEGRQDNVLLEYELACDEAEQTEGFLVLVLIGLHRLQDGRIELWSDTKNQWMCADGSNLPDDVKSVTCGRHTVKETFRRLFSFSTRVHLDLSNVNEGVQRITTVLNGHPRPVPPPSGGAFSCGYLVAHHCEASSAEILGTHLLARAAHKENAFGWCGKPDPLQAAVGLASLDELASVDQSASTILMLSKNSLQEIANGFTAFAKTNMDGVGSDPTLQLIEKAVDRLESDPTAVVMVLVGEYATVNRDQALVWFNSFGLFSDARWAVCSATCQARTVKDTFAQLFQIQGIHMDPKSIGFTAQRIQETMTMAGRFTTDNSV